MSLVCHQLGPSDTGVEDEPAIALYARMGQGTRA